MRNSSCLNVRERSQPEGRARAKAPRQEPQDWREGERRAEVIRAHVGPEGRGM